MSNPPAKQNRFQRFKEQFKQQLLEQSVSRQGSPGDLPSNSKPSSTNKPSDSQTSEAEQILLQHLSNVSPWALPTTNEPCGEQKHSNTNTTPSVVGDSLHFCRPLAEAPQPQTTNSSNNVNLLESSRFGDSVVWAPTKISLGNDSMLNVPTRPEYSFQGAEMEHVWIQGPQGKKEKAYIRQRISSHGVGLAKIELVLSDSTLITGVSVAPKAEEAAECKEIILMDGSNSRIMILKNSNEMETPTLKNPNIKSLIVQSSIMEPDYEETLPKFSTSKRGFPINSQCQVSINNLSKGIGSLSFNNGAQSPIELLPALLIANAENYELVLVKVFPNGSKVFKTSDLQELAFSPISEEVHQIDCMATRFINLRRSALHLPGRILQPDCLCIFEQGTFNIEPIGFMADEEATLKVPGEFEPRQGFVQIFRSKTTGAMTVGFRQISSPNLKEMVSPAVSQFFVSIKESNTSQITLTPIPVETPTNLSLAISAVLQKWQSLVGVQLKRSVRPQLIHSGTFEFEGVDMNRLGPAESILLAVMDPSRAIASAIKESVLINPGRNSLTPGFHQSQEEKKSSEYLLPQVQVNQPPATKLQSVGIPAPFEIKYCDSVEQDYRPARPAFATSSMFAEDIKVPDFSAVSSLEKQLQMHDYHEDRRVSFGDIGSNPKLSVFQSMVPVDSKQDLKKDCIPTSPLKLTITDREGNHVIIYGKENSSVHSSELSDSLESDCYYPTDEIYKVEAGDKVFVSEFKKIKPTTAGNKKKDSKFKHLKVVQVRSKPAKGPRFETGNMEYPKVPRPAPQVAAVREPTATQTPGKHLRRRGPHAGYAPNPYVSSTGDTYNWNPLVKKPARIMSPPDSDPQVQVVDDFGCGIYEPGEVEEAEQSFKKVQAALKRRNSEAPSSYQFSASDKPSSLSDFQGKNTPQGKAGYRFMETIDKLGIGKKKDGALEGGPIGGVIPGHSSTMVLHQKKNSDGMLGTLLSKLQADQPTKKPVPADKPTLEVPRDSDALDSSDQLSKRIRSSRKSSRSRSLDRPELLNSQENDPMVTSKLAQGNTNSRYAEELQRQTDSVLGSDHVERKSPVLPGLVGPLPNGCKMKLLIETPDGGRTELLCLGTGAHEDAQISAKTIPFQANQIPKRMDTIRSEASVQFSLKAFNALPPKVKEPSERFSKKYSGHNLIESVRLLRQVEKEVV